MTFDETEHHPRCDADGDDTKPCECHVQRIRNLKAGMVSLLERYASKGGESATALRVFRATFEGVTLGGEAVVFARDSDEAINVLRAKMRDELHESMWMNTIHLEEMSLNRGARVAHFWNGDY